MSLPPTEPEPPPAKPRWFSRAALGWGLTCAVCAGGVWLNVLLLMGAQIVPNAELRTRLPTAAIGVAVIAAVGGLLGGLVVGLRYLTSFPPRGLISGGIATGFFGGFATIYTMILCREWLNPFVSSTLLWCFVGFLAGIIAHRFSLAQPTRTEPENDANRVHAIRAWICRAVLLLALIAFIAVPVLGLAMTRY